MRAKVKKSGAARILPCAACCGVCVRSLFPGTLGALYQQRAALVAAPGARGPPPANEAEAHDTHHGRREAQPRARGASGGAGAPRNSSPPTSTTAGGRRSGPPAPGQT